jgi:quercetin dioxygenase-like cupin family protein
MARMQKKSFESSTDVRPFQDGKGELRVIDLAGQVVGLATFEPGWRWSDHVKPIAGTPSCESHHVGYMVSGRMTVRMGDGNEQSFDAGDVIEIEPDHDAWVEGQEPVVFLDWHGYGDYAKPKAGTTAGTTAATP